MRKILAIAAAAALAGCGHADHTTVTSVCKSTAGHMEVRVIQSNGMSDRTIEILVDGQLIATAGIGYNEWQLMGPYVGAEIDGK